jgi:4-amino-4-deoxy-L-arabinose transferase-like glycosyltransferase
MTNRFAKGINPSEAIGVIVIGLAGVSMAIISWQKWADPIRDFGHELYIPWVLSHGKHLYKDVYSLFYGPLAYYLNGLLFKLFGTSINVIISFNLLLIAVASALVYGIARYVANPLCAFFSAFAFLALFAFPRHQIWGNFNFVAPYAHAATHGMVLSFLALVLLIQYLKKNKNLFAYGCWFSAGLVMLTKVEIFGAILLSMILTWGWIFYKEGLPFRVLLVRSAKLILVFLSPLLLFALFLLPRHSFYESLLLILHPYSLSLRKGFSLNPFLIRVMGMDDPLSNSLPMLSWLCIYASIGLIILCVNHFFNTVARMNAYKAVPFVLAFLITVPLISGTVGGRLPYLEYFRALPILVLFYFGYLILKLKKDDRWGWESKKVLAGVSLAVFSLVLFIRKIFNIDLVHYGFYLVLPGFLVLLTIVFYEFPMLMRRFSGDAKIGMVPVTVLILCILYSHIYSSVRFYHLANAPIRINQDVMKIFDPIYKNEAEVIENAVAKIESLVKPDETFTAFPEGIIFNYLSRRESPIPYTHFLPPILAEYGDSVLASLRQAPPDFALLVERPTLEYGDSCMYFGKDYGGDIAEWLNQSYVEVCQVGKKPLSGEGFGVTIMQRRSFRTELGG